MLKTDTSIVDYSQPNLPCYLEDGGPIPTICIITLTTPGLQVAIIYYYWVDGVTLTDIVGWVVGGWREERVVGPLTPIAPFDRAPFRPPLEHSIIYLELTDWFGHASWLPRWRTGGGGPMEGGGGWRNDPIVGGQAVTVDPIYCLIIT